MKLLVDCWGKVKTNQGISNRGYFKKMKDACAKLKICSQHFVHFGRCAGLVKAELEELEGYDIDDLGKWNVNVHWNVCSAKVLMKAMQVVGGHPKEKEAYHLPRTRVAPSEELEKQVFPWVDAQMDKVNAHSQPLPTAIAFLKMIVRLQRVFL